MTDTLSLDTLKIKADALSDEIQAVDPSLQVIYAVHHRGQLGNTLHLLEDIILDHPAGHVARMLARKPDLEDGRSAFLGLAAHQPKTWLSLGVSIPTLLAIVAINADQYDGFDEGLFDLYHHTWQAIEMSNICRRPDMLEKLQDRPMTPKRSALNESRSNLRADIFSALMMATDGYENAPERLGYIRSMHALTRAPRHQPEAYPYPITVEATRFALDNVYNKLDPRRARLARAADLMNEISDTTTDDQIRNWWHFCEPAQDMAWRGYPSSEIAHAALFSCEDPFVRAITHQVINVTGITPQSPRTSGDNTYNPYHKMDETISRHSALVQETFELVLHQGMDSGSASPLLTAANTQNIDLLQGRFLGWCASALQAAARAFEQARDLGKSPEQAAKLEFETHRDDAKVETLERLSEDIIKRKRTGQIVTLEQIPELAKKYDGLGAVIKSVELSIAHEKEATLSAAHDHDLTPSMDMLVLPTAPAPTATPAAPHGPIIGQFATLPGMAPGGHITPPSIRPAPSPNSAAPPSKTPALPAGTDLELDVAFAEADESGK